MSESTAEAARRRAISEKPEAEEILSRLSDAERMAIVRALAALLAEREGREERTRRLRAL